MTAICDQIELFHRPETRFRLTIRDDRSHLVVKPAWGAPRSRPGTHLSLLDYKGEEILALAHPKEDLGPDSWDALRRELRARDLTALVSRIVSAHQEYGATYWSVETDRGPRDFVTQNLSENAIWFGENRLLLLDVDGNRFEIAALDQLDAASRQLVDGVL